MSYLRIVFAMAALSLTTACQMDASITRLGSTVSDVFFPAKATGIVSGSSQDGYVGSPTNPSYRIQSTLGSYVSTLEQTTSDGSYVIYSSVQGAIMAQ